MTTHPWNPLQRCPVCGADNECATNANRGDHKPPTPGAVIVCFSCGALMMLGSDMRLRAPTAQECVDIARDPAVQRVVKAHREVKLRRAH